MKYDNTIIYNGKECNALEVIRKLGLNHTIYYKKRKEGLSAQEAFLYCWNYKHHVTIKNIAEKANVSAKVMSRGLRNGLSKEEQQEKREKRIQTLKYLREIGLPKEYNSLTDFCNREQLNMSVIYKQIQNGLNLYEAVQNSFFIKEVNVRKSAKLFGVQLKSIAQKYKLDPNQINFWIRNGFDYQDAIEREVFTRIFGFNTNGWRTINLWKIYQNEFLKDVDIQDKVTDEELENFVIIYNRMKHIKKDFVYYEFLESVGISVYQLLSLDERVQDVLLIDANVSFTLSELYYILDFEHGFMSEFTYIETHHMWIYSGNREVLKKIKKPSD